MERDKGAVASTMYGEMQTAAAAGDAKRAAQILGDMQSKASKTTYTQLGALLTAKVQADKGDTAGAMANLRWVADNGNDENAAVAHLRLAGLLADGKKYDDALKELVLVKPASFTALVSDRRGDIELAQGQKDAALKAYKSAYDGLPEAAPYRVLVEAKLTALGAAPAASAASGAASGAAQ
jgi:predicted negative regulator of RcsB-dependent stress response